MTHTTNFSNQVDISVAFSYNINSVFVDIKVIDELSKTERIVLKTEQFVLKRFSVYFSERSPRNVSKSARKLSSFRVISYASTYTVVFLRVKSTPSLLSGL